MKALVLAFGVVLLLMASMVGVPRPHEAPLALHAETTPQVQFLTYWRASAHGANNVGGVNVTISVTQIPHGGVLIVFVDVIDPNVPMHTIGAVFTTVGTPVRLNRTTYQAQSLWQEIWKVPITAGGGYIAFGSGVVQTMDVTVIEYANVSSVIYDQFKICVAANACQLNLTNPDPTVWTVAGFVSAIGTNTAYASCGGAGATAISIFQDGANDETSLEADSRGVSPGYICGRIASGSSAFSHIGNSAHLFPPPPSSSAWQNPSQNNVTSSPGFYDWIPPMVFVVGVVVMFGMLILSAWRFVEWLRD